MMKCFLFFNGDKKEEAKTRKSSSTQSYSTEMSDNDARRSGSEISSQNVSDTSAESSGRNVFPGSSQRPSNLRVFTSSELKAATRNFNRLNIIGQGGFGCVYRGTIKSAENPDNKLDIAVKKLNRKGLQGHKEWMTEVNVLGVVEHPNLVKLVGYCAEDDERGMERLLIYEFMQNRSVEDHLSNRFPTTLSWPMRLKIALDAACGLTYLHEQMDFQIIFRDLKTSNILLDEHWNAKLSDFGLARHGPAEGRTHVSTAAVGTIGYAAPEYIQTGRLTAKCDVWSYGVVLYELITGRRPMDRNRPKSEQKLLDWVKPFVLDTKKFHMILDPRLEGQYSLKCALKLSMVANKCLSRHPKSRPKMSKVLEMVKEIVEKSEMGNPQQHPLITNSALKDSSLDESKTEEADLKQEPADWRPGGTGPSFMQPLTPKLVKTC